MLLSYVALLRGINVGGKNKLPMKDLTALCTDVGCRNVQSYIQSGNVIFHAEAEDAEDISQRITTQITERFGYRIPVVLRTADEMADAARENPFLAGAVSEETLHILFLANLPQPAQVAALDPNRSAPDTFHVRGREIYLHLPHGMADTKLTNAYFDAKLATISTARNWKTVQKLLAMMSA